MVLNFVKIQKEYDMLNRNKKFSVHRNHMPTSIFSGPVAYLAHVHLNLQSRVIEIIRESKPLHYVRFLFCFVWIWQIKRRLQYFLQGVLDDAFAHSLNRLPDGRFLTVVGAESFDLDDAPDFQSDDRLTVRIHNANTLQTEVEHTHSPYRCIFDIGHFYEGKFWYFGAADPLDPLDFVSLKLRHGYSIDLHDGDGGGLGRNDEIIESQPILPHFGTSEKTKIKLWRPPPNMDAPCKHYLDCNRKNVYSHDLTAIQIELMRIKNK